MTTPTTLAQLFLGAVDRFGTKQAALRHKEGGRWLDITHQQLARKVKHVALGLRELGVQRGERVAILSANRPEWAMADFGCLTSGFPVVPIYPTLRAHQISYLLQDSGARAIFVEDQEQFDKIAPAHDTTHQLRHIIALEPVSPDTAAMGFHELLQIGASVEGKHESYRQEALSISAEDVATIVYTSGTTGEPKGVVLTQGNLTSNALAAHKVLPVGARDVCLSLLPLSHAFERTAGHFVMFHAGVTIAYAENIGMVPTNMREVKPTIVISVPRLYEKMYARVVETGAKGGALKRRVFHWVRKTAGSWTDRKLSGQPMKHTLAFRHGVARRLVLNKLKTRMGGRLKYFVSGGAPLMPEIGRFFYAAGLPVLEGYGLTETSPIICVNPPDALRLGSVGLPVDGVEIRIASDGEIETRGPHVMREYLNKPDETAKVMDAEGWFRTGDIGEIDSDGYLRITDRKKDLIVTAGGKNVAPQPIENQIKVNGFVRNAVMLGDRRKFLIVLIVPEIDAVVDWAGKRNLPVNDHAALLELPDVHAKLERETMLMVRDLARYQMPKKVLIVAEDFTVENDSLTPTLKVKRRVIEERYKDRIEALYSEPPPSNE